MRFAFRWVGVGGVALAAAFGVAGVALAQTPLGLLYASPDVTTSVGVGGGIFADEDVLRDEPGVGVTVVPLGPLPHDADVEAYHLEANGEHLLVFESSVLLPGGLVAEARDVVRYDGAVYELAFDGSAHGVPNDVGIDALTRSASGDFVLSFDATFGIAEDEDLVRFDGANFTPYFDGSAPASGVPVELDLDAAHRLPNDHLLLSFDATAIIAGLSPADEDLLEFDPATGSWQLAFDASAAANPWPVTSDLDAVAVPEPSFSLQLRLGGLFVALLARRRQMRG
jgi:hypothetical protein